MSRLFLEAYWKLISFHSCVATGDFAGLYQTVRRFPLKRPEDPRVSALQIFAAIDLACIWYWKEILCLQRSAAAACLLRQHGVPAEMIIGAQHTPFRAHAWVEVEGKVVGDKPYTPEIYRVLDRC